MHFLSCICCPSVTSFADSSTSSCLCVENPLLLPSFLLASFLLASRDLRWYHMHVSAGAATSITAMQPLLHLKGNGTDFQTCKLASAADTWQTLTGHYSGDVQVWQQCGGSPLQPLLVLAPRTNSPIRSLVVMDDHLLCCGHADEQLTLYMMQAQLQPATSRADHGSLPAMTLKHAVYQAHCQGLSHCVRCAVGLMSVSVSGTILMWSKDQIRSMLQLGVVHAEVRRSPVIYATSCPCF